MNVGLLEGLNRASGLELEKTLTKRVGRHRTNLRHTTRILALLVVEEVEHAIGYNLAADGRTKLISN